MRCPRKRCGKPLQATVRHYVDIAEDGTVTDSDLGCEVEVYCEDDHPVTLERLPVRDRKAFDLLCSRLENAGITVATPTT